MLNKYERSFRKNDTELILNQIQLIEAFFESKKIKDFHKDFLNELKKFKYKYYEYELVKENNLYLKDNEKDFKGNYFIKLKLNNVDIFTINIQYYYTCYSLEINTVNEEIVYELENILSLAKKHEVDLEIDWENTHEIDLDEMLTVTMGYYVDPIENEELDYTWEDKIQSIYSETSFDRYFFILLEQYLKTSLTLAEKFDICVASNLFTITQDIYRWYSECSPNTSRSELQIIIQAYLRWKHIYEQIYPYCTSFYYPKAQFSSRPLVFEFVAIAQMAWYFYCLEEALPILEDSLHFAKEYMLKNKNKLTYTPITKLNGDDKDFYIKSKPIWDDPEQYWYFSYCYLGDIYYEKKDYKKAIECFVEMLKYIPNFSYINPKYLHHAFYYECYQIRDTKLILKYLEELYDLTNDDVNKSRIKSLLKKQN